MSGYVKEKRGSWVVYCNGILIRDNDMPYAVGAILNNRNGEHIGVYRVTEVDENSRVCLAVKL